MKLTQPPDVIWLQFHGDGEPDLDLPVNSEDVTWSSEQVFKHDVNYVNAWAMRRLANAMRNVAMAWDETPAKQRKLRSFALELEKLADYRPTISVGGT